MQYRFTVEYARAFLWCDWLYFLWHGHELEDVLRGYQISPLLITKCAEILIVLKNPWATSFDETYSDVFIDVIVCLFVPPVAPQFIEIPDKVTKVTGNSVASLSCRALAFPPATVVWSRGLVPLPQGRSTVINGTLTISNFSPEDAGPYQCKATNKLGSISALTTLNYFPPGEFRWV